MLNSVVNECLRVSTTERHREHRGCTEKTVSKV
jgi:hypothetical protein